MVREWACLFGLSSERARCPRRISFSRAKAIPEIMHGLSRRKCQRRPRSGPDQRTVALGTFRRRNPEEYPSGYTGDGDARFPHAAQRWRVDRGVFALTEE